MAAKTDIVGDLRAPREVIGETLVQIIDEHPETVVIDTDLGKSTRLEPVEERRPGHLLQLGVAEQNAMGIASGLAYSGHRPVYVSMAMFSLGLPWTQLRQAAYAGLPLVIVGTHPGLDMGPDGGTHQMLEDLALAQAIPELYVLTPCDSAQTAAALRWAVEQTTHPVYIRIGRHPVRQLHDVVDQFEPGTSELVSDHGRDVVLIAEGSTAALAADTADVLATRGVAAAALHLRSLKPLDNAGLLDATSTARLVVSVENHSIIGGLGATVSGVLGSQARRIERVGTPDVFGWSATAEQLRHRFGLEPEPLADRVQNWLSGPGSA